MFNKELHVPNIPTATHILFYLLYPPVISFVCSEISRHFKDANDVLVFLRAPVPAPPIFNAGLLLAFDMHSTLTKHSSGSLYRSGFMGPEARRSYSE